MVGSVAHLCRLLTPIWRTGYTHCVAAPPPPEDDTAPGAPAFAQDSVYLAHILEATERIALYMEGGHHRFMVEPQWQDAVMYRLQVIGEAMKRLSPGLRSAHPEIPWGGIIALGDALIRDYPGVDLVAACEIAENYIPNFRKEIEAIIRSEEHELEGEAAEI